MNDVKSPTPDAITIDEQALGRVHQTDTPSEPDSLPQADSNSPMDGDAPLAPASPITPATQATQATPIAGQPDVAALIAEAEQRGYLRGRNEAVELAMKGPAMWQLPGSEPRADTPSESDAAFLRHIRPSVWD